MAQTFISAGLTVVAAGGTITTGAASARIAIPVDASGNLPNYIRVAARNECYCRLGTVAIVATAADFLVQPGDSQVLAVPKGVTHIAAIQGGAAGVLSVVPLENS